MVFESLFDSANKHELILVDGGMCRFHIRRDGQLTIHELIVLPERQRQGIGSAILDVLKQKGCDTIVAKCPDDLPSNDWYKSHGFCFDGQETSPSGRFINKWILYSVVATIPDLQTSP